MEGRELHDVVIPIGERGLTTSSFMVPQSIKSVA
jgi:hypothetical protein